MAVTECMCLDDFLSHAKAATREKLRDKFTQKTLDKGQFIFFEGARADTLFLIETGVVEANVVHGDGKVYIFHFLFPGDIFGEGVLYGQDIYPFSTVVRKDASVWKVPSDELFKVLEADPSFEKHLLQMVGLKLDLSYTKARCIAGERVERRVACILLKMIEQPGIMPGCTERLDTPLTNRDISGLIGSTEETVSRVMSRLKKEGVIGIKDKQLQVLDREALMNYVDSM